MTTESILLVARAAGDSPTVLETHAERLESGTTVDRVRVATYEQEPVQELRGQFREIDEDTVYAVPMCGAHTHATLNDLPAALSYVQGTVHYCAPVGESEAVTDALQARASETAAAGADTSLILVGFGSSSKPHQRETVDRHAERLRERSEFGSVLTCYLIQNPTVECVRYNVTTSRAVAVPVFVADTEATNEQIPAALELDRGGIEYADPLGTHPRVTDAIRAAVEKRRALAAAEGAPSASFEDGLLRTEQPVATDGEGP